MISAIDFVDKIALTPDDYWNSLAQATVLERWYDTTQIYEIEEQKAIIEVDDDDISHFKGFEDISLEESWEKPREAWVGTISDDLVNSSKIYSDFVNVMFKNLKHKQNYRGQYYKFKPDKEHEETYICYDRMNRIKDSQFKCVRCNNVLTWIDNKTKSIITLPCYLGNDISSTNNYIGKDGIVSNTRMIILVQANEFTSSIIPNQRFMFEHSNAFKVEEVNNYMHEEGTEGQVTCIRIYVDYSPILPGDNRELNICDYSDDITLTINSSNYIKISEDKVLTSTLKLGGVEVVDNPPKIIWESSDESVVTIDEDGTCHPIGNVGDKATITCSVKDNSVIRDSITVEIASAIVPKNKTIVVTPNDVTLIREKQSITFEYHVEQGGAQTTDGVRCIASNVEESCYELNEDIANNKCDINVYKRSTTPLILTFSADGCDDVILEIKLRGLI